MMDWTWNVRKKMKDRADIKFFFGLSNRKNEDLKEYGLSRYNRSGIWFGVHEGLAAN